MHDIFFLDFFADSSAIVFTFNAVLAAFILLGIKDKSSATVHLGIGFFYTALLALSYLIGCTLYHPWAAYYRWLSVPSGLVVHIHVAQAFFYFPTPRFARVAKGLMITQYLMAAAAAVFFMHATLSRDVYFLFPGHNWDFESEDLSRLVGGFILINIAILLVSGIVHLIVRKDHRLAVGGMLGGLFMAVGPTSVANVLSRDGLLARDVYQTILIMAGISGYFVALVVYFNHAREKTSFMLKIMGVSLVTFMLVMAFVCFFGFQDKEDAYDAVKAELASRLSVEPGYDAPDLEYLVVYDHAKKTTKAIRPAADLNDAAFQDAVMDFVNTDVYEKIRHLSLDSWKKDLPGAMGGTPVHFSGYRALILEAAEKSQSPADLLRTLDGLSTPLRYRALKIRELPDQTFRTSLLTYLLGMPPALGVFRDAVKAYLDANPSLSGKALKRSVLAFFTPFRPESERHYRAGATNRHYTAFFKVDTRRDLVYEAGFSYLEYRKFIEKTGTKLLLIFLAIVVVVVLGFRLFFLGALVRPLESLLDGVRKVNKGDLDVEVPVSLPDEIGFLTESFNSMVASIRSARQKLERYADELEEKVRERTAELSETLQTVQDLKSQQDGDYFLTSLLIKPLTRNATNSPTVHVEFLIEQKKKFEFRHWKEEIGGDFCSAHAITLRGKSHTVFVNADAMGKSMQGAGGALVLGAVFESLMKRTKTMPILQNQSPERWLKNAFQELQSVFESFDGSMLVSMVLGVIDDETGLLYYVNVEHPWTVLYRTSKATFIEREGLFRKLGISGLSGRIIISTYQMQPGDVLIVGSDGRDDLVVGSTASGERMMNEDENLFLRAVESSDGLLGNIRSNLEEFGTLSDDLSLIRIAYRGTREGTPANQREEIVALRKRARALVQESKFEEAVEVLNDALRIDSRSLRTIRMLVQTYLQQKDYEKAFDRIEDYIYLRPLDTEIIYLASHLCGKLGRLPDAAEFGERVRLRSPDFVRNLLNLADVYLVLGNQGRAGKMLDEAAAIEPGNPKLAKLRGIAAKTVDRKG